MCSHYQAENSRKKLERMGVKLPPDWMPPPGGMHIYPTQLAPIIRRPPERDSGDDAVPDMELVPAHFGLLPGFAKDLEYGRHTYNARTETVREKPSFKHAWAKARHCIIPAAAIYEPDWRTGKSVSTRITRADSETLGLAGLWQPWKSPAGEWVDSFTMLTINADTHAIFKHLHKPQMDKKTKAPLPPELQDKRMVVVLDEDAYADWLSAPAERSMEFLRQYPAERLVATPEAKDPGNG